MTDLIAPNFSSYRGVSGNSTLMVETGISKGTYYYRVMAHNECGSSSGWTVGGPITVTDSGKPMPWLILLLY